MTLMTEKKKNREEEEQRKNGVLDVQLEGLVRRRRKSIQ